MSKSVFALCDWENRFVNNFMEYFVAKALDSFDIRVFTDVEALLSYYEDNHIDILLIANSFMSNEIEELDINTLIILSEGDILKKYASLPIIYKYQSSEKIISEILSFYADTVKEADNYYYNHGIRIIGVYSPVRRSGKTSMALSLGQLLARNKKVLYLNMEEFSGLQGVLDANYKGDLLDIIFYQRQKNGSLRYKLQGMTCRINDLDYITPAFFSEELRNVKGAEWLEFIDMIDSQTDYEVLILDMGETVNGLINIMEKCSVIYMPKKNDFFSQGKILQFEEYMKSISKEWLLDKITKVDIPEMIPILDARDYIQELYNGPFANDIRMICMEEYGSSYA